MSDPHDSPLLGSDSKHTPPQGRRSPAGPRSVPPASSSSSGSRYGSVAAAGPFAGRGGWFSYGGEAIGQNLEAALPFLDWVAVKYPLDEADVAESAAFVHDIVWPRLRPNQRLVVWEQDAVTGVEAVSRYTATAWIGVGESSQALAAVCDVGADVGAALRGVPRALATTFVPDSWPAWAVAMFELYQGDGTPILDNTPLAQLAALGAPAVVPIAGGFGGHSLEEWFPQLAGQGFPGVSAWTVDAFPPENVQLLGSLPWAGTDAKAAA